MKRSIATPTSARVSTWCGSATSFEHPGPIKTPVGMKPTADRDAEPPARDDHDHRREQRDDEVLEERVRAPCSMPVRSARPRAEDALAADVDLIALDLSSCVLTPDDLRVGRLADLHAEPPSVPGTVDDVPLEVSVAQVAAHVRALIPDRVERALASEERDLDVPFAHTIVPLPSSRSELYPPSRSPSCACSGENENRRPVLGRRSVYRSMWPGPSGSPQPPPQPPPLEASAPSAPSSVENEEPQPQVFAAFGLEILKPPP